MDKLKRYDKAVISTCPNFFSINFLLLLFFFFFQLGYLNLFSEILIFAKEFLQRVFAYLSLSLPGINVPPPPILKAKLCCKLWYPLWAIILKLMRILIKLGVQGNLHFPFTAYLLNCLVNCFLNLKETPAKLLQYYRTQNFFIIY